MEILPIFWYSMNLWSKNLWFGSSFSLFWEVRRFEVWCQRTDLGLKGSRFGFRKVWNGPEKTEPRTCQTLRKPNLEPFKPRSVLWHQTSNLRTSQKRLKLEPNQRFLLHRFIEYQKMGKISIWYLNEPENSEPRTSRTSSKPNLEPTEPFSGF
jgi:hypothetical protein